MPTRRGARVLADAFVGAAEGRAVLPPQMRPLGDLDEGEAPFEEDPASRVDPLAMLAEAAGSADPELWWEQQVERRRDALHAFREAGGEALLGALES